MKKTYQTPSTEVVQLIVKQPMLLPISSTETETQLAPEMDTETEFLGM